MNKLLELYNLILCRKICVKTEVGNKNVALQWILNVDGVPTGINIFFQFTFR